MPRASVETLRERVRTLKESGLSIVLAEQNLGFVLALSDMCHIMEKGEIVYSRHAGSFAGEPRRARQASDAVREAETFREEGVAVLRGVLDSEWLDRLAEAVAANMASPGPYGRDHAEEGQGSYFGDYVNWRRFPAYLEVGREGPLGRLAGALTGAERVQFFHEHVLVKEPGTSQPTPWHQDMPYYCMSGAMTVSFWVPLDPVRSEVCPHFLAGSHRSRTAWLPRRFKTMAALEGDTSDYEPFPDIDETAQAADIRSFDLEPGDAVAFDFHTLHNARPTAPRRAAAPSACAMSARTPAISNAPTPSRRLSPISASAPSRANRCRKTGSRSSGSGARREVLPVRPDGRVPPALRREPFSCRRCCAASPGPRGQARRRSV